MKKTTSSRKPKKDKADLKVVDKEDGDFVPDTSPMVMESAAEPSDVTPEDAEATRNRMQELRKNIDNECLEMCQLLWKIQKGKMFELWGYGSFKEYVAKEMTFKYVKATYYISIWQSLYENQADKTLIHKVMSVGWTKAKEMVKVITAENVDDWVRKANELNVEDLIKEVKKYLEGLVERDVIEVREGGESEVEDTPAEEAIQNLTLSLKYDDYSAVANAIDQVKEMTNKPDIQNGEAISLVCRDFMASNPKGTSGRDVFIALLRRFESILDLKCIVLDDRIKEVVHGQEYIAEFAAQDPQAHIEDSEKVDGEVEHVDLTDETIDEEFVDAP